jgi:hypothetical protein
MGWLDESNESYRGHEGYLVAVVQAGSRWRELGAPLELQRPHRVPEAAAASRGLSVHTVQVGCECGWRSPRFRAVEETSYFPYYVDAPAYFEERAKRMWHEQHLERVQDYAGLVAW